MEGSDALAEPEAIETVACQGSLVVEVGYGVIGFQLRKITTRLIAELIHCSRDTRSREREGARNIER